MDWLTKIRLKYRQESKCKSIYMCWCCYICWYIRIKSTGSIQGRTSQWGRVWGLKTKHPKSFQLISSWKPQHPKCCLLSKELNPNVDKKIQKKKIKSRGWMSQWGRVWGWKALKTGGRAFLSAQRACVCTGQQLFFCFCFLFCFVFAFLSAQHACVCTGQQWFLLFLFLFCFALFLR